MKYITVGLLLLICFFGGMTYGSVETNHALVEKELQEEEEKETMQMEPYITEDLETDESATIDRDQPVIHQAAALFEKFILSIYGFFIELMYGVANLFF